MNSSDSLLARHQLHFISLYESLQLLLCKVGSLQFRNTLSIHTDCLTPRDPSMVLIQVLPILHGLRPISQGSTSLCFSVNQRPFLTMRQNSRYVTVCIFCSPCCLDRYLILPLSISLLKCPRISVSVKYPIT